MVKQVLLLLMGLCALFVGGVDYFEARNFKVNGRESVLELALPGDGLKYNTDAGYQYLPRSYVPASVAERVTKGERIEIIYIRDDPRRRIFKGEEVPQGGVYLLVGLSLIGVFAFSLRLPKK